MSPNTAHALLPCDTPQGLSKCPFISGVLSTTSEPCWINHPPIVPPCLLAAVAHACCLTWGLPQCHAPLELEQAALLLFAAGLSHVPCESSNFAIVAHAGLVWVCGGHHSIPPLGHACMCSVDPFLFMCWLCCGCCCGCCGASPTARAPEGVTELWRLLWVAGVGFVRARGCQPPLFIPDCMK